MSTTISSSSDYSYLFNQSNSTSNNTASTNSSTNMFQCLQTSSSSSYSLSDYASLKSGSYYKLAKEYYKNVDKDITSANTDTSAQTQKIRTDASSLKNASDLLSATGTDSIFKKVKSTASDGTVTTDYDRNSIYENIKNFISQYNSIIKSAGDSENNSILKNTLSMVKMTSKNSTMLGKIGITINEDNTLSLDETKNKSANITAMKALFNGSGSYMDNISNYASRINNYAVSATKANGTYTASGSYSSNGSTTSGNILNNYL